MLRFIGDVHGKFTSYKKLLKASPYPTVQIGDMGVGFYKIDKFDNRIVPSSNPPYDRMVAGNHRFIRGNHDNPKVCVNHTQWIADGTMEITEKGTKIMYVGGAWSIDQQWRIKDYSWWADEELSMQEFDKIMFDYLTFQPDVMVTHDFPMSAAKIMFLDGTHKPVLKSRTGQAFDAMFHQFQPKMWIAGHWHEFRQQYIMNTEFICLGELEIMDLDL